MPKYGPVGHCYPLEVAIATQRLFLMWCLLTHMALLYTHLHLILESTLEPY